MKVSNGDGTHVFTPMQSVGVELAYHELACGSLRTKSLIEVWNSINIVGCYAFASAACARCELISIRLLWQYYTYRYVSWLKTKACCNEMTKQGDLRGIYSQLRNRPLCK
jgi:hypothetical protein